MDPIMYWNAVALEANRRDFTTQMGQQNAAQEQGGPTLSSRALAIVHLAMYDAYAGCRNVPALPRYLPAPPSPAVPTDAAAAVAAAAHRCLSALYKKQTVHFDNALRDAGLRNFGLNAAVDGGIAFGRAVADAMLKDREQDPGADDVGYVPPAGYGQHRADPGALNGQPFHGAWYGQRSKCFLVSMRHALAPPPAIGSSEYIRYLEDVRGKGIAPELMGTLPNSFPPNKRRTENQTLTGIYWAYDGVEQLGTPPRLYNLIVRALVEKRGVTATDELACLFALVNGAMGDAGILAWEQKYRFNLWRPVLGIREHDRSMGDDSIAPTDLLDPHCDPNWMPLGAPDSNKIGGRNFTPPFPAYPSGHATFGAAAFHTVRLFFNVSLRGNRSHDDLFPWTFVSEECNGNTRDSRGIVRPRHERRFPGGLWQMIEENGFSRVSLGVHWAFDAFKLNENNEPEFQENVGGVALGVKIAEDIVRDGVRVPVKSTI